MPQTTDFSTASYNGMALTSALEYSDSLPHSPEETSSITHITTLSYIIITCHIAYILQLASEQFHTEQRTCLPHLRVSLSEVYSISLKRL